MIKRIHERLEGNEEGFTLIELLVVVIIIGILAAIAIPAFLSQRERAWDSAAQSDLRNAAVSMESFATGNDGSYAVPASDSRSIMEVIEDEGFNQSTNVTVFDIAVAADGNSYTITASHDRSENYFVYSSTDGTITPAAAPATTTG